MSDSVEQGALIAAAVTTQGYNLAVHTDPNALDRSLLKGSGIDVWVVDISAEDRWSDFLDAVLDDAVAPIIFGDGQAPSRSDRYYPRWERRITGKLIDVVGKPILKYDLAALEKKIELLASGVDEDDSDTLDVGTDVPLVTEDHSEVKNVWVLGASLGGPEAVKEFIDVLPADLPVAFVMAQHIDPQMLDTLGSVLVRHSAFSCSVAKEGDALRNGHILLCPCDGEITFDEHGIVQYTGKPWDGPYDPSIDQVLDNVSARFKQNSGAVIFSGMGNDGSIAGPSLVERGGTLWAQESESCAVSSQPDSVRATGAVQYSATPKALAFQLQEKIKQSR